MTSTTLAFPTPASLGSLDNYIQAVNRFPLLTQEQETALGRRLRNTTTSTPPVAGAVPSAPGGCRSRSYLGYGLPQADLIQEGNVGLMKAVQRFDPDRGVRLVSFAVHWIRAEMHEYILRNWRMVKVATTKAQRKLFFNLRSMKTSHAALSVARGQGHRQGSGRQTRGSGGNGNPPVRSRRSLDADAGDEENDAFSPICVPARHEDEPGRSSSARRRRRFARGGWNRRCEARRPQPRGSSRRAGCARTMRRHAA